MKYAAAFYFEQHPVRTDEYHVAVRFPDLMELGLPAMTVGSDLDDAIVGAKDILEIMREDAKERGITLPEATPLHKINVDHGYDAEAFRILVEYVSI